MSLAEWNACGYCNDLQRILLRDEWCFSGFECRVTWRYMRVMVGVNISTNAQHLVCEISRSVAAPMRFVQYPTSTRRALAEAICDAPLPPVHCYWCGQSGTGGGGEGFETFTHPDRPPDIRENEDWGLNQTFTKPRFWKIQNRFRAFWVLKWIKPLTKPSLNSLLIFETVQKQWKSLF